MRRFLSFAVFLGFFAELAVMIAVGQRIGVLPTLLLIVASMILGGIVSRSAGIGLLQTLRRPGGMRFTTEEAAAGFLFMVAGLLLILPGFISDVMGLALLPRSSRQWLARRFMAKLRSESWQRQSPGPVIEGEAVEIEGEITDRNHGASER